MKSFSLGVTVKRIIFLAALLLSSFSFAARPMTDLMFIPESGKFHYDVEVMYGPGEYDKMIDGWSYGSSYETKEIELAQSIGYSFYENFEFSIGWDYTIKGETTQVGETLNGSARVGGHDYNNKPVNDSGIQDPQFFLRYRLADSVYLVDLFIGFSPSLGKYEKGNSVGSSGSFAIHDGNAYRGGHQAQLGFQVGRLYPNFQWSLDYRVFFNGEQEKSEQTSTTTKTESKIESHTDMNIEAEGLYTFTKKIHLGGILGMYLKDKKKEVPTNSSNETTIESRTDFAYGVQGKYLFGNSVLGKFKLVKVNVGDYTKNTSGSASLQSFKNHSQTQVSFGAEITF